MPNQLAKVKKIVNIVGDRNIIISVDGGINKETALTANLDISGSAVITGSFAVISGSSREFQVIDTGVNIGNIITDTHTVTGSLNVSGSITGSLLGTASYAITASFALNGGSGGSGSVAIAPSFLTTSFISSSASLSSFTGYEDFENRLLVDCSTNTYFVWTASSNTLVNFAFTSSFISASTNNFGGGTSGVLTLPAGGLKGDVYLAGVGSDGSTPTFPAEWTLIDNSTSGLEFSATAYLIQTSSTVPSNPTITTLSTATCGFAMLLRNVDHNNVTASYSSSVTLGASGMPDPPAISASRANSLVVAIGYLDDDSIGGVTAPTNFTMSAQVSASGLNGQTVMAATRATSSVVVNPSAFGGAGTDEYVALSLAFFPPSGSITLPIDVAFTNFPVSQSYEMTHLVNVQSADNNIFWTSSLNSFDVTWWPFDNYLKPLTPSKTSIFKFITVNQGGDIFGQNITEPSPPPIIFNRQITGSYTLTLADIGEIVEMNTGSANVVTVPSSSVANFATGSQITVVQYGAGQTRFTSGSTNVTIRSANNFLKINARYGAATLTKVGTDEWYLIGNLNA